MITEKKFLICTCDSCGKLLFDDEDTCVFGDIDALKMAMMDEKWYLIEGSYLCYNCYLKTLKS